jgi:hypothetical protein
MHIIDVQMNRRQAMATGIGLAVAPLAKPQPQPPRKTVAAIANAYGKGSSPGHGLSHSAVIFGKMLKGYSPDGVFTEPRTRLVSMYTEQVPFDDLSRVDAATYGYKVYSTIKDALTLGGDDLAVDAVCYVGEHGEYPWNERGQKLYPRYEIMERIVEVFRRTGKSVPVFSDKHFSYSWSKAIQIYGWSRELNFPFMAGSSIPVNVRTPFLEFPYEAEVESAVVIGYGDLEAYGFHTLESLQCMVERRKGGETGIRSVEWLEGEDVWKWRDGAGRWSIPLLEAALSRDPHTKPGRAEDNVKKPVLFLLEYRDGLRAAAYMLEGHASWWTFAGKLKGSAQPVATCFEAVGAKETREFPHFDGLEHCIEELFVTGKPPYPVERTFLTTCALSILFESRVWKKRIETSELAITYRAPREIYVQRA